MVMRRTILWVARGVGGDRRLCHKTFSLGTMGIKVVVSHMKSAKHKRLSGAVSTTQLLKTVFHQERRPPDLTVATSQSTVSHFVLSPDCQKAEVLHCIARHHSFISNNGFNDVFAAMFPDSECAKHFTCGEDKTIYLAKHELATFIKRELTRATTSRPYTIMFDESMNKTTRNKQLDLHVRHWSEDKLALL
ncbi:hypothetical protein WMY93_033848 [Mugilogobius chulae]|uniref:Transposase n=1 Tax=Mugilogobius chulae TaxID=88201 RepID=A0AAW0MH41_9GOBI